MSTPHVLQEQAPFRNRLWEACEIHRATRDPPLPEFGPPGDMFAFLLMCRICTEIKLFAFYEANGYNTLEMTERSAVPHECGPRSGSFPSCTWLAPCAAYLLLVFLVFRLSWILLIWTSITSTSPQISMMLFRISMIFFRISKKPRISAIIIPLAFS